MRAYATRHAGWWTGQTGKALRRGLMRTTGAEREAFKDARILGDWMQSAPASNMYGLYYVTKMTMVDETGLRAEEVDQALGLLASLKFASYDDDAEYLWVVEMARFQMNAPLKKGDRLVRNVNEWYRKLPRIPFLGPYFDRYVNDLHLEERRSGNELVSPGKNGITMPLLSGPSLLETYFQIFLESYPPNRRVGGERGRQAFYAVMKKQANPAAHMDVMLGSLWVACRSGEWRKDGGEVIPSMVRWLDEEQWTRSYAPPAHMARMGIGIGWHCDGHEPACTDPGDHALRIEVEKICRHEPKCGSFGAHYDKGLEEAHDENAGHGSHHR